MEGNEQLVVIIPMLKQVGAGIAAGQLDGPTPCVSFSVSGVLDHMTGLASAYAPRSGETRRRATARRQEAATVTCR